MNRLASGWYHWICPNMYQFPQPSIQGHTSTTPETCPNCSLIKQHWKRTCRWNIQVLEILMVTSSLKISHWCVFLTDKMSIFRTHCQIIQIDSFHQYSHLVKHSTELPPHTTNGRLVGVTHCLLVCCSVWSDLPWEQLATGISSPLSCGTKHFCIKTRLKTTK